MKYNVLWNTSLELLTTFEPKKKTVDAHLTSFLKKNNIESTEHQEFLKEVLYGINKNKAIVKSVTNQYYKKRKEASVKDIKKYHLIVFLAYVKLGKILSFPQFKGIVKHSLSLPKLYPLLNFLFEQEPIYVYIIPSLLNAYDHHWIEDTFLTHIETNREDILNYSKSIEQKATGSKETTEDELPKITEPEPFNLTKSKIKLITQPKLIETTFKANPVPESTYSCEPQVRKALDDYKKGVNSAMVPDDVKMEHRTKQETLNQGPLFTALNERKDKVSEFNKTKQEAAKKVEIAKDKALANSLKPKSIEDVKKMLNRPAPVKYNATAIMREDGILKAKQKKEEQLLRRFESELRDSSEFFEWQEEMRARDALEKELKLQQLKLEMELSDARAKQAKIDQETQNAIMAREMKEEMEEKLEKIKEERKAIKLAKKEAAEQQNELIKAAVKQAKKEAKQKRLEAAEAVRIEKKKNEMRVARELELERQRREEQILQIRAKESVKPAPLPKFDATTTAETGLLGEMSYVELQERLKLKEQKEQLELEEKKESIQETRQRKRDDLKKRAKAIAENREQVRQAARKRHISKLRTERLKRVKAQEARDSKILALQQQIQSMKEKKQSIQQATKKREKERAAKAQFLGANKAAVERKHWGEQEKGKAREAKLASRYIPNKEKKFARDRTLAKKNRLRREGKVKSKKLADIEASIREQMSLNEEANNREQEAKVFNATVRHDFEVRQRTMLATKKQLLSQ
mmetsp:Transcript_6907/g.10108  ORF Transcript_6907/g.10108 Transcript_6907/m.10108 type:complete len:749 (-) Transcript_6907:31-2277(-)